ncbi:MAG TPA: hypothetical protein VFV99_05895 [Kofleriaceae bacterium]|nr:hypothetical protein [Kofleriaceae bacterium]
MRSVVLVTVAFVVTGCGRLNFDPLGRSSGGDDAGNDAGDDAREFADGPGSGGTFTYTATIAECIDPTAPDPAFCRTTNGQTELPVDLDDSNLHVPFYSYLRFDFDASIAGKEVAAVVLRAVISDGAQSDGPDSGEIWRVSTFTLASLSTQAPTQQGGAALAASQGPVVQLQEVDWLLPTTVIDSSSLCLGMIPVSAAGVNYWNLQGATPPTLRVELR